MSADDHIEPPVRPASLTYRHAYACLPGYEIDPEWQKREDAGENSAGIMGFVGSIRQTPAAEQLTPEEAMWIMGLSEMGSMRWVAGMVFNDSTQIYGNDIIEAAKKVLAPPPGESDG